MFRIIWLCVLTVCAAVALTGITVLAGGASAQESRVTPYEPIGSPTPCTGWQVVESANMGTNDNALYGVDAVSANDVWAVGNYFNTDGYAQTLIEHWNGTTWSVVPSPNPGTLNNFLYGASATAANDVWAVGWYQNTSIQQPLTMHWDGSGWTVVPMGDPNPGRSTLFSVAAISPNDAWAVGQGCINPLCQTRIPVAIHWDGTQWANVTLPNVPPWDNYFYGVSAAAPNDVWAVGEACTDNGCPTSQTLIEHWNGTAWAITPSPSPGAAHSLLNSVAARSASDVWAVGQTCADAGCASARSLIEHWDGTSWTQAASPNPGTADTHLNAVAVVAADDAWAVGSYTSDGSTYANAVIHWDGSAWTALVAPNPGAVDNDLRALAAISANDIWAVGDQDSGSGEQTQIQHYTGQCASSPTATATATAGITNTPTASATLTPAGSPTPCMIAFSDVHQNDYFYEAVTYLSCHGVVSGYSDGTFRPYNNTTRGQLTKIIVLAEGWTLDCPLPGHFVDVLTTDPFFCYIETAYRHSVISGYADGTFRSFANVTRAQLCKIVVLAESWTLDCPTPHFTDVPTTNPFFCYVETAYGHGVISGYADGTFRPGSNATRGQISKIVYEAVTRP